MIMMFDVEIEPDPGPVPVWSEPLTSSQSTLVRLSLIVPVERTWY
ncbi:hypothetical protein ACFYXC_40455 [Streptomyces sp. NPDC002701]